MKIAFVYDHVNKFGGAERVLLALHEIWRDAPLYTAVYNSKQASWSKVFKINVSWLRHLSFFSDRHEILPLFTPIAFESFNFKDFDVVLSVTSSEAKGIITGTNTLHICYCLTPTRYLWSGYTDYIKEPGVGSLNPMARVFMKVFFSRLRLWDKVASSRPDYYISISRTVSDRIKKYYKRDSSIIYPPVDLNVFKISNRNYNKKEDYFLIVSRLVPYKKIDYVISAFNKLGWKLVIIGSGIDQERLEKKSYKNIIFVPQSLTDQKLCWYYQNCRAFIFPGEEDFGLTSVEAQACGKPVVAYVKGGVKESIVIGETGELYDEQNEDSLITALNKVRNMTYDPSTCRKSAERFTKKKFQLMMKKSVESLWNDYQKNI